MENGSTARRRILMALAMVAAFGALLWVAQRIAVDRAVAQERQRLTTVATLAAANFSRQIDMFELVATTLSADPEVGRVLERGEPLAIERLNARLATLSARLETSVIYLMDSTGKTVVSSNWRQRDSFVGENYAFRRYFTQAMAEGASSQFGLGTRSRIPGLFLGRRIVAGNGANGVLVVKIRFDRIEREWARTIGAAFVTDQDGVILVTSSPGLRFRSLRPLAPERRVAIRAGLPVEDMPLTIHPDYAAKQVMLDDRWRGERLLGVSVPATPPFQMWTLGRIDAAARGARNSALLLMALMAAVTAAAYLGLSTRRRLTAARAREEEQTRAEELKNRLEQANRLSLLGQVAAGVGHEINQPIAAISMRAGSASRLIDAARLDEAKAAMTDIERLIHRLGRITGELRNFSRRSERKLEPVRLDDAIEGLTLLLGDSLRRREAILEVPRADPALVVMAEQVRLEQVLVNLVRNALEAGGHGMWIWIEATAARETIRLKVSNDGQPIPPEVRSQLFQPFTSTKTDGLGLGLLISRDIVSEFGGRLSLLDDEDGRTTFCIELRRAG
ncbi:sensor histidine kinase [Sphingomonas glaciei]|uniref:histidine kinase n=1 Tax=Sphingomonas glaciei TaxID=2938948 RepID=A0ABY5MY89_9SPHN|nr:ATP-binding protein [Sphingomonas glaciei]UUR08297.1 ATP-binding protein [Sphingomonas glaciei]